jgi:hypothetical protein
MNLRYDALPGEWLDEEPVIDEPWPDEPDTDEDREEERPMRACCICGHTNRFELEAAGDQAGYPIYGCIDIYACERRFEALLTKMETTRIAVLAGETVQAA